MIFLRKLLLIAIVSRLTIATAFAQTLAQWNFDASTNTPTTVPANATISAAAWTADATTTYPAGVTGQSMSTTKFNTTIRPVRTTPPASDHCP